MAKVTVDDAMVQRVAKTIIKEVDKFIKETDRFFKEIGLGESEPKEKFSSRALKIDKVINDADFGCKEQAVRDLVTIFTGEKLPVSTVKDGSVNFRKYVLVIPINNPNDHNYLLGKICYPQCHIRYDGTEGNHMDDSISSLKKPTHKQIEDFVVKNFAVINADPYEDD